MKSQNNGRTFSKAESQIYQGLSMMKDKIFPSKAITHTHTHTHPLKVLKWENKPKKLHQKNKNLTYPIFNQ